MRGTLCIFYFFSFSLFVFVMLPGWNRDSQDPSVRSLFMCSRFEGTQIWDVRFYAISCGECQMKISQTGRL